MVIEEYIGALDVFVFQDGLQSNRVRLKLLGLIQVVVALIAMLMAPPLFEVAAMKTQVEEPACSCLNFLPDGITELRFIDEGRRRIERLKRGPRILPRSVTQLDGLRIIFKAIKQ